MVLLEPLLQAVLTAALLMWLQRFSRRRRWPKLPLRLSFAALMCWVSQPLLASLDQPARYAPWINLLDELLISLASVRLGLWLVLELPAGLGW
ncbi:MAG: hypothetical protein ACKO8I_06120, partial [Cyanobacteriota bacterium]